MMSMGAGTAGQAMPLMARVAHLEERVQFHEKKIAELGERLHRLESCLHGDGPKESTPMVGTGSGGM